MSNIPYPNLLFLKLGGSLITEKAIPREPRLEMIAGLASELKRAYSQVSDLRLVLGHGSGSFGHVVAKKYGTRQGVDSADDWHGFAEVWYEAKLLNRIVIDSLHKAGLPGISFPASSAVTAQDGQVKDWNLAPLIGALDAGFLPVVFGDVVFDQARGGTILSTEDIFSHLARQLKPKRIMLAGIDDGVWADFPECNQLIPEINSQNWESISMALSGSAATDVTGGMRSKVQSMYDLIQELPGMEVVIFNGSHPGNLSSALRDEPKGTRIIST